MLVLSRKIGERIHIGDNITIEIRRVAGNRVTLALDAPRTVRILRGELEKAAREFTQPAAAEFDLALCEFHDAPDFHADQQHETAAESEPYAVIHRRFNVVPEVPSSHVSSDFAL